MAFTFLWGTGFEMGNTHVVPATYWHSATLRTNPIKTGTYSTELIESYGAAKIEHVLETPRADIDVGLWANPGWDVADYWGWSPGGGMRIGARLNNGNFLEARYTIYGWNAYVNGSLVGSYTTTVNEGVFHNIQVRFKCAVDGYIHIKIDGNLDIEYNGDTRAGATTINRVGVYNYQAYHDWWVDDWVIGYGGWTGDMRFQALQPTADVLVSGWSLSTGSTAYTLIDEIPPNDDTDYIYASAISGATTIVDIEDFSSAGLDVQHAIIWARVRKVAADDSKITILDSDGIITNEGDSEDLLTTYTYLYKALNTTPSGEPWSDSQMDNLKIGVKAT